MFRGDDIYIIMVGITGSDFRHPLDWVGWLSAIVAAVLAMFGFVLIMTLCRPRSPATVEAIREADRKKMKLRIEAKNKIFLRGVVMTPREEVDLRLHVAQSLFNNTETASSTSPLPGA